MERNQLQIPDAVATNNNIMKFTTISLTNTTVNNACSMEATTSFLCQRSDV